MAKTLKKLIFVFYIIFVFCIMIIPFNKTALSEMNNVYVLNFRLDYLLHTVIFLPWVFLCQISFAKNIKYSKIIILSSGLLLALFAEYIHHYIPYRAFNINDMLFNALGVILGTFTWLFTGKKGKIWTK